MMDDTLEPGRASRRTRCDAVGEWFAEDLPWAADEGTAEPADLDAEMDGTAVRRQVPELPIIPTMNLRRSCAALRAGSIWRRGRATISRRSGSVVTVSIKRPASDSA
jgi:hypothetical protein